MSDWWLRLRALLEAEREEERARFAELRGRLSLREREARGFALADVEAQDEAALAGRALVTYGRADGRALAGSRMGVGSLVKVQPRRSASEPPPPTRRRAWWRGGRASGWRSRSTSRRPTGRPMAGWCWSSSRRR